VVAGVVGGGFMGEVHTRAIRAAGATVAGVASSSAASSGRASARLGVPAFASTEQLLLDPDVDVVHICTPNTTHAELALSALAAGKHVVCEKPIATTVDDARRIQRVAAETGLTVAVPFVYRFHPMVREAADRVCRGGLGTVHSVQACYLQDWLLEPGDDDWRVDQQLGGPSRAFADIGSHLCDLVEFVLGERIGRLSARTRTVLPQRGGQPVLTEDLVALLFETASGTLGTAMVSQMAAGRKNRLALEVMGTEASIAFDQEAPDTLWLGQRRESRTLVRDAATLSEDAARLAIVPVGHPMGYQDAFNAFVRDAYLTLGGGEAHGLPTAADGVRAAVLTSAVLTSASAGGEWADVSSPDTTAVEPTVHRAASPT
jgi:predicted dehydrogenase